jgi:mycothiol S-conjugate amidase
MFDQLCLLSVHAHPDDESSKGAGTVARYHAEGVRTVLVTCTGGEEGEILNPAMDRPEVRADIAAVRRAELDRAVAIIGYDGFELLGYRDSGMAESPANDRRESFAQAPVDEAVGRLVAVIRRERPQVILTYGNDERGYRHPDHLKVHEISVLAFDAAGDEDAYPETGAPFEPLKLYYTMWDSEQFIRRHEKFEELGLTSPYVERMPRWLENVGPEPTTMIDITGFENVRGEALLAHATQIDPESPQWFGLPPEIERSLYSREVFLLAKTRVGPTGKEDDLFAGLRAAVAR